MGSSKSVGSEGEAGKAASEVHAEVHADSIGLRSARRLDRRMHAGFWQSHKCNTPNCNRTNAKCNTPNCIRTNAIRRTASQVHTETIGACMQLAQMTNAHMQFAELQSHKCNSPNYNCMCCSKNYLVLYLRSLCCR